MQGYEYASFDILECGVIAVKFHPLTWVRITFCGVNYAGRVSKIHIGPRGNIDYTVEYVDDTGALKSGDFRDDEIEQTA